MRCAERRPQGGQCRRAAVAAVVGEELVTFLCRDCTLHAVARVRGLGVRWLADRGRTGSGRAS